MIQSPANRTGLGEDDAAALTDMRRRIIADSHALICLGGKVEGYSGRYPGVLEEIALSLSEGRPVYLLGGFGGATADAATVVCRCQPG